MRLLQFCERGLGYSKLPSKERHKAVWAQLETFMLKGVHEAGSATIINIPRPVIVHEWDWGKLEFFVGAPCSA